MTTRLLAAACLAAGLAVPAAGTAYAIPLCDPTSHEFTACLDEFGERFGVDLVQYCMQVDPPQCG